MNGLDINNAHILVTAALFIAVVFLSINYNSKPLSEMHYSELMVRVRLLEHDLKEVSTENAEMKVIIALFLSKQDDEDSELEKEEIKRRAREIVSKAKSAVGNAMDNMKKGR